MSSMSTTMDERSSPLLSMPNELVEIIATSADDAFPEERPLCKLRLTCRQLRDQVNPEFAQRYLSEPFIMMSRYSLGVLVEICRHPIFGSRVRKVRLHSYADMTALWSSEESVQAVESFIREEMHLQSSSEAMKLLRTAFNSLSGYARPLVLGSETFYPDHHADKTRSAPIGLGRKAISACRKELNCIEWNNALRAKILQNLLELANESGCRVQGIEMRDFDIESYHNTRDDPFNINHGLIPNLTTARFNGYICDNRMDGFMSLSKLINQAKRLTSLSLGNYIVPKPWRRYYLRGEILLDQIRLPALQVLDLDGMLMPLKVFQRFLIEHKHTLKQIHLRTILIGIPAPGDTSLSRTMGWIHDNISLHKVTLGAIRVVLGDDWRNMILQRPGVPWHSGITSFDGSAAVRAGLNELCDEHKRLRKLSKDVHSSWEFDEKSALFARTAGISEEDFRRTWVS